MRTTLEILGSVERGEDVTPEELLAALMVTESVARLFAHELEVLMLAVEAGRGAEGVCRALDRRDALERAMRRDFSSAPHPAEYADRDLSRFERVRLAVGREVGYDA